MSKCELSSPNSIINPLMDYSDLEFTPISPDQYRANLYYQIRDPSLPDNLSTKELEYIIDPVGTALDTLRPWLLRWMYRPGGPVFRLAKSRFYQMASSI